jgi:Protein of unknown function (DUF3300)
MRSVDSVQIPKGSEVMEGSSVIKKKTLDSRFRQKVAESCLAILCSALLVPGEGIWAAQAQQQASGSTQQQAPASGQQETGKLPPDQLDSLVAPIALYPDPMLAQVLAASTYPLEIMQLQQWLGKNKDLKDKALVDAVSKQPWDPSVQGLAALPDVVKRLADDIQWTTDLGNAFLAQQSDVMDAVQRMRKKAKDAGNLKSTEQQKVETKVVETKQVIVVEQANPQVIYVPTYNPTVVYGPPVYPYPPIVYPPPPPPGAYVAGMAVAFGVGMAMGAAWSGGWGYNCGWQGGNNNITINNNNNFNRNTNVSGGNRVNTGGGGGSWQHNPQHRGGAPYSDRSTANKFGGTTRGASTSQRQASARQNQANAGNRNQSGSRSSQGQMDGQQSRGNDRSSGSANRASSSGGGGNRPTSTNSKSSALGGGSSGKSGSSAKASSSRGSSSMGSRSSSGGGGGRRR